MSQGDGGDSKNPCKVMLCCLDPFRVTEAGVAAKDDPIEDRCMGVIWQQHVHVHEHPEGLNLVIMFCHCGMD